MLTGCASAPRQHDYDKMFTYAEDYESIWKAVIATFAELNLPISNLEKDSGLVMTDWIDVGSTDFEGRACDCGKAGLATTLATRMKFNVFVRDDSGEGISVTVNVTSQQLRELLDEQKWFPCTSLGSLESAINVKISSHLRS
jgi:uncharacterized lipoprotein